MTNKCKGLINDAIGQISTLYNQGYRNPDFQRWEAKVRMVLRTCFKSQAHLDQFEKISFTRWKTGIHGNLVEDIAGFNIALDNGKAILEAAILELVITENDEPEITKETAYPLEILHPLIQGVSEGLFKDGHNAPAIFESAKALEVHVKKKVGSNASGDDLMNLVFNADNPIIRINELVTDTDKSEQRGLMYLMKGVVAFIRNPKGHEVVFQEDKDRTFEYLCLLSVLAKVIDDGKVVPR